MLDAVYNHLGPDGNYLGAYTKNYFNPAHKTPWGDALNFDGPHNGPVRQFFLGNIVYWMEEFRFDGFRLDAVHAILDESDTAHPRRPRGGSACAGRLRHGRGRAQRRVPRRPGKPTAAAVSMRLWADDFHHSVRVALTGEREAYLKNFTGSVEELADTLANGWHYRGQATPTGTKSAGPSARNCRRTRFAIASPTTIRSATGRSANDSRSRAVRRRTGRRAHSFASRRTRR